MTIFNVTQSGGTIGVTTPIHGSFGTTLTDGITIKRGPPVASLGVQLRSGVNLAATISRLFQGGAAVNDRATIRHTQSQTTEYHVSQADAAKFLDRFQIVFPASLHDAVTISQAQSLVKGWLVLDRFRVAHSSTPTTHFSLAILDAIRLNTSLANFFGFSVSDHVGVHHSQVMNYVAMASLQELITIAPTLTTSLIMQVVENDLFNITDAEILKAIYNLEIDDFIDLSALYVSPDGNFTTWAINTRTASITEYQNYAFNSFAQTGRKFIAASKDGIYELDGERDPGAVNIVTAMRSGFFAPNGSKFTSFRNIYVGMRTQDNSKEFILKLIDSYGREYIYSFKPEQNATTKINTGKGLRARFFAFELITPGPDFDLNSIEFRPLMLKRRV